MGARLDAEAFECASLLVFSLPLLTMLMWEGEVDKLATGQGLARHISTSEA